MIYMVILLYIVDDLSLVVVLVVVVVVVVVLVVVAVVVAVAVAVVVVVVWISLILHFLRSNVTKSCPNVTYLP